MISKTSEFVSSSFANNGEYSWVKYNAGAPVTENWNGEVKDYNKNISCTHHHHHHQTSSNYHTNSEENEDFHERNNKQSYIPQTLKKNDNSLNVIKIEEPTMGDYPQNVDEVVFKIRPEMFSEERHLVIQVGLKSSTIERSTNMGVTVYPEGGFSCPQCKKTFVDQRCIQRHMLVHKNYRPFRCNICGKAFMLNSDLKRHILIHSGDRPFGCEVCGRRFTLKGNLMQHFRTHVPEKQFTCTICRKAFAQRDSLYRHIRAHFGEKPYPCPVCGKRFSLKGDLGRHQLIHSGTKNHCCPICNRKFALKGNMTQHMRIHNKTPEKTMQSKTTMILECKLPLKEHISSSSSPSTIKKSSWCIPPAGNGIIATRPQGFTQNRSNSESSTEGFQPKPINGLLTSNEQICQTKAIKPIVDLSISKNPFVCRICCKQFQTNKEVLFHMESHNQLPLLANLCDICQKSFESNNALEEHIETEHGTELDGEESVACSMCQKRFKNQRNLSLHIKRHETARANFGCVNCGSSFLSKSDHFFHTCHLTGPKAKLCPQTNPNNGPRDGKNEAVQGQGSQMKEPPNSSSLGGYQGFLSPFYRHMYYSSSTGSSLLKENSTDPTLMDIQEGVLPRKANQENK